MLFSNVAGVAATLSIVHANMDKLDHYEIDNDDSIIAVADIPQQSPHAPLVVNVTDDDDVAGSDYYNDHNNNNNDNAESKDNNNSLLEDEDDGKPVDLVAATNTNNNKSGSDDQGVQRS